MIPPGPLPQPGPGAEGDVSQESTPPSQAGAEEGDRMFEELYSTRIPEEVREVGKDTGVDIPPRNVSPVQSGEVEAAGVEFTLEERLVALEAELESQNKELALLRADRKSDARSQSREMSLLAALNAREAEVLEASTRAATAEKTIEGQKRLLESAWHRVAVNESEMQALRRQASEAHTQSLVLKEELSSMRETLRASEKRVARVSSLAYPAAKHALSREGGASPTSGRVIDSSSNHPSPISRVASSQESLVEDLVVALGEAASLRAEVFRLKDLLLNSEEDSSSRCPPTSRAATSPNSLGDTGNGKGVAGEGGRAGSPLCFRSPTASPIQKPPYSSPKDWASSLRSERRTPPSDSSSRTVSPNHVRGGATTSFSSSRDSSPLKAQTLDNASGRSVSPRLRSAAASACSTRPGTRDEENPTPRQQP